jgi:hypothetical protein
MYGPVQDKAFLGWSVEILDNQVTLDWSKRLFNYLLAGESLQRAADHASDPNRGGAPPLDAYGNAATPRIYGDNTFKLHGVYGPEGTAWWQ